MDGLTYDQIINNVTYTSTYQVNNVDFAIEVIENILEEESDSYEYQSGVLLNEIDIPKPRKRVYKQLSIKKVSKVDYIKKAEKDVKIGLSGEELVLELEKNKMLENKRSDLAEKIDWVSSYDDSRGYDILSFEFDEDGNEHEIFIEVKTTEEGKTSSFFITANEIKTMQENEGKYWIYRVCNVKKNPEFFKINAKELFEKFDVQEYTYIASLK